MRRGPGRRARGLNCRRRAERAGGLPFVTLRQVRACRRLAACGACVERVAVVGQVPDALRCRQAARAYFCPTILRFLAGLLRSPCYAAGSLMTRQYDKTKI